MAYTPTEWQCGDVISAEKLNKLEQGVAECCSGGSGVHRVKIVSDDHDKTIWDCTWQEVYDALERGEYVTFETSSDNLQACQIVGAFARNNTYRVVAEIFNEQTLARETSTSIFGTLTDPNQYLSFAKPVS